MKQKPLVVILAVLLFATNLHAQPRPLLWGADEEGGAPYVSKDPAKGQVGFEVEFAAALAAELHQPIQFKQYEFNSLLPGLLGHDFDFAMNGIEDMPERRKQARASRPYYVYQQQLVVRKDETRFKTFDDLLKIKDQVRIGTLDGSAAYRSLVEKGFTTKPYTSQDSLYLDLDGKQIDAIYLDWAVHSYYLRLPQFQNLKLTGEPRERGTYVIYFRKEDEALAERVDKAIGDLIRKGTLRRILQRWNIWNDDQLQLYGEEPVKSEDAADASDPSKGWTFQENLLLLLEGAWMTIQLACLSMLLAVALGLPIALARLYGPAPVRLLALLYIEFFRGIPVLFLLFFLYFGGPRDILLLNAFWVAVLGLGINYAAYEAEIYRAAIGGIPPGQWEAGASLGMSNSLTFRRIILPQAIRTILPPMTNDFVALFKDTSVVSIIAVVELSKQYQILSKTSFQYVELGLLTAGLYLVMSVPLGHLSRYLEKRWGQGDD